MKKLLIYTSTRAEFGLLKPLIEKLKTFNNICTILVVSGGHLDPSQGYTIDEIIGANVKVDCKIDTSLAQSLSKKVAIGLIEFSKIIDDCSPDALLVLGDRYEIYSAVIPAYLNRLKIFHIGGGEETLGSLDDGIRHSISKLANFHFVSTAAFKEKLVSMGEVPDAIDIVGALGTHDIPTMEMVPKNELESKFNLKFLAENVLITYHPNSKAAKRLFELKELLHALERFPWIGKIFTYANLDESGVIFNQEIEKFCIKEPNATVIKSFGRENYLSIASYCDCVIGNSSSGLIEIPSLRKPTLNIGDRQKGRPFGETVLNSKIDRQEIARGIKTLLNGTIFHDEVVKLNPYFKVGTIDNICSSLVQKCGTDAK